MHNVWKKALMPYANSKCPDERAHLCSLIWTFAFRRHILQYPFILQADNGCSGWYRPSLSANYIRALFVHCTYYINWPYHSGHINVTDFHTWKRALLPSINSSLITAYLHRLISVFAIHLWEKSPFYMLLFICMNFPYYSVHMNVTYGVNM